MYSYSSEGPESQIAIRKFHERGKVDKNYIHQWVLAGCWLNRPASGNTKQRMLVDIEKLYMSLSLQLRNHSTQRPNHKLAAIFMLKCRSQCSNSFSTPLDMAYLVSILHIFRVFKSYRPALHCASFFSFKQDELIIAKYLQSSLLLVQFNFESGLAREMLQQ